MSTTQEGTATGAEGSEATSTASSSSNLVALTVPGVFELTEQGRERYEYHVQRVATELLKETSNLASGRKTGNRKRRKEFHSDHVDDAFKHIAERGLKRNPKSLWYVWGRIIQAAATLVLGLAGIFLSFPEPWGGWGYIVASSVAVAFLLQAVLEIVDWYTSRS